MAALLETEADNISFAYELGRYPIETYAQVLESPKEARYYFLLAAAAKVLETKHALDLGTCAGMSAIAMAKYALHVTTVDITWAMLFPGLFPWFGRTVPVCLERDNMTAHLVKPQNVGQVWSWAAYDLVFVDTDPHDGVQEAKIHVDMINKFNGYAFYDDINQPKMAKFWKRITQPKIEMSRGNVGGTIGLVRYGQPA